MAESAADKLVIDHHVTQDELGAKRLVDISAEATGRLVHEAVPPLAGRRPRIAHLLSIALAMDTGWFRHPNTTAASFACESLMKEGVRPDQIHQQLYERQHAGPPQVDGLCLERLQVTHQGLTAYTEVRAGDYLATELCLPTPKTWVNFPAA